MADMPEDDGSPLGFGPATSNDVTEETRSSYSWREIPPSQVVVFVDMLGFSTLSENNEVEEQIYEELQRPGAVEFLTASLEDSNQLSQRFVRFHLLIADVVREVRLQEDGTSITFSDCAFFATGRLHSGIEYAVGVMQRALHEHIPVRIGIAYGQFLVVRIKADFGFTNQDHVVQFLGSGVSRANAAERCGPKGLRILLHPSVLPLFTDKYHQPLYGSRLYFQPIPLTDNEQANRVGVTSEVNCYWHPRHDTPRRTPKTDN